jgi:RNA polymerase sigma-70 factor (ECF subfamily)
MVEDPDKELVDLARGGDKKAFNELVNRYYEMVYIVCFGVLRNREAARDKSQDVFIKVFKSLEKFKGDSKFKTWLYRVSMNASIDQTRRKKPQVSLDATDVTDEDHAPVIIVDERQNPMRDASRNELKVIMRQALEKLSEEHRAILHLREWNGLSYEEIAEALEIETGTVMSRLFYARKKLGEALKSMNVNSSELG